jgi:hypothetical protein
LEDRTGSTLQVAKWKFGEAFVEVCLEEEVLYSGIEWFLWVQVI